jgi:hypothetical protein
MLHLHPAALPASKQKQIRDWLGQAPGRELVDFLVLKDAEETALSANSFIEAGDDAVEVEEAAGHRTRAIFYRKVLELLAEMRKPDFKYQYQEPKPKPATTQPPE